MCVWRERERERERESLSLCLCECALARARLDPIAKNYDCQAFFIVSGKKAQPFLKINEDTWPPSNHPNIHRTLKAPRQLPTPFAVTDSILHALHVQHVDLRTVVHYTCHIERENEVARAHFSATVEQTVVSALADLLSARADHLRPRGSLPMPTALPRPFERFLICSDHFAANWSPTAESVFSCLYCSTSWVDGKCRSLSHLFNGLQNLFRRRACPRRPAGNITPTSETAGGGAAATTTVNSTERV